MPKIINLTALEKNDIPLLLQFFKSQAAIGVKTWKKDISYTCDDVPLSFTHDVYQRAKKVNPDEVRYEVISNTSELGSGASGMIKPIEGTLAFLETGVRFREMSSRGNRRVVKIQRHTPGKNPIENIATEYKYASRPGHCAPKEPVVTNPGDLCISYLTMRRFPGEALYDIIVSIRLTTKERIALSKGLLLALKNQVENVGLVHRDIKPDNIIVDIGPPMNINIIDYAYSRDAGMEDTSRGTISYIAPESIYRGTKKVEFSSDIYSMGRVIALLWNVNYDLYDNSIKHVHVTPEKKLEGLFSEITDLHATVNELIKTTLTGMLSNDPESRLSLDDAIREFSRIGVSGTEPVLVVDTVAGAGVTTTPSDAAAGLTKFADAMSVLGLMASPPKTVDEKTPLPDSSFGLT